MNKKRIEHILVTISILSLAICIGSGVYAMVSSNRSKNHVQSADQIEQSISPEQTEIAGLSMQTEITTESIEQEVGQLATSLPEQTINPSDTIESVQSGETVTSTVTPITESTSQTPSVTPTIESTSQPPTAKPSTESTSQSPTAKPPTESTSQPLTEKPTAESARPTQTATPVTETTKPVATTKPAQTTKPVATEKPIQTVKPTPNTKPTAEPVKPTAEPAKPTATPSPTVKPASKITLTVDASVIGQGKLVSSLLVDYYEGEPASYTITRGLKEAGYGYSNTGTLDRMFYLSRISKSNMINSPTVSSRIQGILDDNGMKLNLTKYNGNSLGEFDFTKYSGWRYSVNGSYAGVGMSEKDLKPGDSVVLKYTLCLGYDD